MLHDHTSADIGNTWHTQWQLWWFQFREN